jgi:AraC family transcriptional regulator
MAALELQQSDIKVIDLAIKYGYESPVSFARAFQVIQGISPSEARKSNVSLKAFPKMTFQIIIKGVSPMNYRIVKTEPFKVFGVEGIISTAGDPGYYPHEGAFWSEVNNGRDDSKYEVLFKDAGDAKLPANDTLFVKDMCRINGLFNYNQIDDTTYGYMLCSFVTPKSKTDDYKIVEIPAATWAVFPSDMPDWDVGEAMGRLMLYSNEWISTSCFEKVDGPEFEMYGGDSKNGYIEYWMPITTKP